MAKRYFNNVFSDSQEISLDKPYSFWKDQVRTITESISQNALSTANIDNDLYTGTTGIAYMFYRLAVSDQFYHESSTLINKAIAVLKLNKKNLFQKSLSQFICGDAGVNAVNAVVFHQAGDDNMAEKYLMLFRSGFATCKPIDFFKHGGDELFVGRTGYLYGVLWLEKMFGKKVIDDKHVIDLCSTIVESGRRYSKRNKSLFPLMYSYYNTEYLGKFYFKSQKNL